MDGLLLTWGFIALLTAGLLVAGYKAVQAMDEWAVKCARLGRWTVAWVLGSLSVLTLIASVIGYVIL